MEQVSKLDGFDLNDQEGKMFNMGKDSFDNVTVTGDKKVTEVMKSLMSLNFNNKNVNSLEQIFGMISKMYNEMKEDGSRM